MKPQAGEPRDRINRLLVVVNASERKAIEARAAAAGLSVSAYLRAAALGHPIRSSLDHVAVDELMKLNADQARLGNLLKAWIFDRHGEGKSVRDVHALLDEIRDLQSRLAEIAGRV